MGQADRKTNFGFLSSLSKGAGQRNDPDQIETPFRLFENEHWVAVDGIPMTGRVKRLEAALLRDPLSEELDRAAFLDAEVERQPSAPLVIRYGEECRGRERLAQPFPRSIYTVDQRATEFAWFPP